ncbi:MAG: phospholipase [Acidimicrobiia bacterium]|nr:phospholipase [Acidimicrobiia bacterium]
MDSNHPHGNQPVLHAGAPLADARLVAILVHGRGASAEDIIGLAGEFSARDIAYLAPQASGGAWYPYSFLAPLEQNEPFLPSALRRLDELVGDVERQGVPPGRVAVMGFSQGACLSLEFAARHARRYAAVVAFSGGLIGPPGTARDYAGAFDGTPVFIGCSDVDAHIPLDRVQESAEVFRRMGAAVDERIYPRMGHTIVRDELLAVDALLQQR